NARSVLRNIVRDRNGGVHYAAAQAACHRINDALEATAEQPPALGGEPVEPWYYYADCADPDYSCLCNNEADALTEVADHGGSVVKLWNVAPNHHLAPLQAEIERWKASSAVQKDRMDVALELAKEHREERDHLKARCDELEGLLRESVGMVRGTVGNQDEELSDRIESALSKPAGSEQV
ncbi:hypothetical protein, partial [Pseudomonas viridiflava]